MHDSINNDSRPAKCDMCGTPLPPDHEDERCFACMFAARPTAAGEMPGDHFGRYELVEEIGKGGMGVVWSARQNEPGLKREVALKILKLGMDTQNVVARFEAERQALAMMDHPAIARVFDAGATRSGRPYFVMERVRGVPLTDYCDEQRLDTRERLNLFVEVCRGVQHAHQKGVIHRDIKPSNILVTEQDQKPAAKVIDFGIAKAIDEKLTEQTLTKEPGRIIGTLGYMSPEQAGGQKDIDTRTDVYSLGVVLYELLTGRLPFPPEQLEGVPFDTALKMIREEDPPKPSTCVSRLNGHGNEVAARRSTEIRKLQRTVSGDLDWIVMMALEKERSRRYESPNELARDIERHLNCEPVNAAAPSSSYKLGKFVRKHRNGVITAAAMVVLLAGGAVASAWQAVLKEQARAAESAERAQAVSARRQAERRLEQIEKANGILGSVFESLDPKAIERDGRPLQAILVEKLDKAIEQLDSEAIGEPLVVASIQSILGVSLINLGEPEMAMAVLEKALETRRAELGLDDRDTLTSMNNLALAYLADGNLDLALSLLEDNLVLTQRKLGTDHPDTFDSMNSFASAHAAAGNLDQAIPLYEETLKRRSEKLGPDHRDTLETMSNFASAHLADGNLDRALPLFKEAQKQMKAQFGPHHPDTLTCKNNLASCHKEAGNLDLALPLYREVLELRQDKLGPRHPDTLTSMNNLATVYSDAGKITLALPLYKETLELTREVRGHAHPDTLISMNNLAVAYKDAGELDPALTLFKETLRLSNDTLGSEHPFTLTCMHNFASGYGKAGKLDQALTLFEQTLKLRREKLGTDHPHTLATAAILGMCYRDAGQFEKSLPPLEEAFRAAAKHPNLRWVGAELLDACAQAGKNDRVEALAEELVADARKRIRGESFELASLLARIGAVLLRIESFTVAENFLRESLVIRKKTMPDSWLTFNSKSLLGAALMGAKKFAEAEPLLLDGYDGMKQREKSIPPRAMPRLTEAIERLVTFYKTRDNNGDREKAARYRHQLEQRTAAGNDASERPSTILEP